MNETIKTIQDQILNQHQVTLEEVKQCQELVESAEDLFTTYWIMSRYYVDHNEPDAVTYCALKCYELNEIHHFDLEFKVKDFLEARTDFMEEAIWKTRKKLIPLSVLFGLLTLILIWLIMSKGEFTGFIIGFIAMNLVSISFQQYGSKKTLTQFKKKQYAAVYEFLNENDKKFADEH